MLDRNRTVGSQIGSISVVQVEVEVSRPETKVDGTGWMKCLWEANAGTQADCRIKDTSNRGVQRGGYVGDGKERADGLNHGSGEIETCHGDSVVGQEKHVDIIGKGLKG